MCRGGCALPTPRSCLPIDPYQAYAQSHAAIIGVYMGKRDRTTYLFRIEEDYKVDLPAELGVLSAESGASCGIEATTAPAATRSPP